ncbi:MAG TPA: hypothetical protein VG733_02325, partial [Chthoniobacteraceae bacterium]|nr:hypothetical protein [Chthoniobacteraceae bacterium]
MTDAQYSLFAAKLEKLTAAANAAPAGNVRAEKFVALGDAWAGARGRLLLLPLDGMSGTPRLMQQGDGVSGSEDLMSRRDNGATLGFKDVDPSLEDRDELRHASRWWMRAARENPGSAIDASARLKALEAMTKIASLSEFAQTRARETKAGEASKEIYDRLLAESPDSPEAKQAAYWSFPEPRKDKDGIAPGMPETGYASGREYFGDGSAQTYEFDDYGVFGAAADQTSWNDDQKDWDPIDKAMVALIDESRDWKIERVADEVDKIAKQAHALQLTTAEVSRINFLDDLALFAREKGITSQMLQTYVKMRIDVLGRTIWDDSPVFHEPTTGQPRFGISDDNVEAEVEQVMKDPAMKPVEDYVSCAHLALLAARQISVPTGIADDKGGSADGDNNSGDDGNDSQAPDEQGGPGGYTYSSRNYKEMEKEARAFLEKYPHSAKREAVMFVLARAVQALSRPHVLYVGTQAPGTKKGQDFFVTVKHVYHQEPFNAQRVLKPLDDYDREFPHGRYSADIASYRAYVAWQTHDWARALDLTLPEIEDTAHADIATDASLRLAAIFAALADKDQRPALLGAIRARPQAVLRLKQFLSEVPGEPGHPLWYMQAYLTDQLALK